MNEEKLFVMRLEESLARAVRIGTLDRTAPKKALARKVGVNQRTITRYTAGDDYPSDEIRERLATVFGVPYEWLSGKVTNNYPLRYKDVTVDDLYLVTGCAEPLEVYTEYEHTPLPTSISQTEQRRLVDEVTRRAKNTDMPYNNWPNARLLGIVAEEGEPGITLRLGPVSWDEFSALNFMLDDPQGIKGMRRKHAPLAPLFSGTMDFSWCTLSNILTVALLLISTDGYGLIVRRSEHGVGVTPRVLSCVTENVDRYLDEMTRGVSSSAPSRYMRRNKINDKSIQRNATYRPQEAASPYLSAQRGIFEEVSTELGKSITQEQIVFLNVTFNIKRFHPVLCGIVNLKQDKETAEELRMRYPGSDRRREADEFIWTKVRDAEGETDRLLHDLDDWDRTGLAAFISGLNCANQLPD